MLHYDLRMMETGGCGGHRGERRKQEGGGAGRKAEEDQLRCFNFSPLNDLKPECTQDLLPRYVCLPYSIHLFIENLFVLNVVYTINTQTA